MQRIGPAEAKALMDEGWTYLDVRTKDEFAAGHPTGAVNIAAFVAGPGGMVANPSFADEVSAKFGKDQKLVLGCQAGGRSLRAATLLEGLGFTSVVDQRAGFGGTQTEPGWQAAGLPVER